MKNNEAFQTNCLAYTLFHGQNRISSTISSSLMPMRIPRYMTYVNISKDVMTKVRWTTKAPMKPITASSVPCDKPSLALGKRLSLKYMSINSFYNLKISSVATPNSGNITEWITSPSTIGGRARYWPFSNTNWVISLSVGRTTQYSQTPDSW